MTEQEADGLNAELLAILREAAPWAAEQIEESVRQGKPIAKQVRRRGGKETVSIVALTGELGRDQFVATQELTSAERLRITLDALERLLIDPSLITDEVRLDLREVGVSEVQFAELGEATSQEFGGRAATIPFQHRERISALLNRLRSDIADVG